MNATEPEPTGKLLLQKKRKKVTFVYWGIILLLIIAAALYWVLVLHHIAYTNDAYVTGNLVKITPLKQGFVTAIHTDDTYLVKQGQLIIELDSTDAKIALEQAKKELAIAVREICQAFHQLFALRNEIETKKAEFIRSAQDYQHRADVLAAEGVSLEDFQHALAAIRETYFSLKATESHFHQSLAFVQNTSIKNHPLVQSAADSVRDKWVQLYRCKIYSPVDGLTAQRTVQVGMWVPQGKPLLSVIPLDQIWLNANFKETQLERMKIGQPVSITSDVYGSNVVYHGHILGLPGAAGNAFSLLPPENLSGNWIKIVQRLPVRVGFDPEELKKHPLRIGLSMEARVDLDDQEGLLIPTSSEGSPTYETSIFSHEETGDHELIHSIIYENLDPSLWKYFETPLLFQFVDVQSEMQCILHQMNIPLEELYF